MDKKEKRANIVITAGEMEQGKNTHQKKKGHRSYNIYIGILHT